MGRRLFRRLHAAFLPRVWPELLAGWVLPTLLVLLALCQNLSDYVHDQRVGDHPDPEERGEQRKRLTERVCEREHRPAAYLKGLLAGTPRAPFALLASPP